MLKATCITPYPIAGPSGWRTPLPSQRLFAVDYLLICPTVRKEEIIFSFPAILGKVLESWLNTVILNYARYINLLAKGQSFLFVPLPLYYWHGKQKKYLCSSQGKYSQELGNPCLLPELRKLVPREGNEWQKKLMWSFCMQLEASLSSQCSRPSRSIWASLSFFLTYRARIYSVA